ncbi:MAG TPA: hypothetical protein VHS31_17425 [Tepidisphaeraceae bacterium]|jgi:hypothetical protein|nr:hypothetical protein [Tepidisphaeraceae bacterium]
MSDIDLAISHCKTLESLLERGLGASGRGLHEKVSSVESRLPRELVRKLRLVATVRNKVVHEADYKNIDDRKAFLAACRDAERELKKMAGGGGGRVGMILTVVAALLILAGAAVVYRFLHLR